MNVFGLMKRYPHLGLGALVGLILGTFLVTVGFIKTVVILAFAGLGILAMSFLKKNGYLDNY